MKKTVKIITLILAFILCLVLAACGSDVKTTTDNNTKNDTVATENPTDEPTGTAITLPDLEFDSSLEGKAIFTMEAGGENDEIKVYYKDDVIQSITLTSKAPADGRTKDELNQLKDQLDASFAEISEKELPRFMRQLFLCNWYKTFYCS